MRLYKDTSWITNRWQNNKSLDKFGGVILIAEVNLMAKFSYSMSESDAILAFKKGFMGQGVGNVAILKDKGNEFVLGAPMMTVKVKFKDGICETSASLIGKALLSTVNTKIELIDGFKKIG